MPDTKAKLTEESELRVSFCSFGYKHGIPLDADYIFDCRDLPNPFWVESLRHYTGLDQPIIDYFSDKKDVAFYINNTTYYLAGIFEKACKNGRKTLHLYFGCTGGQHRSVYVANALYQRFKEDYSCSIMHRDYLKNGVQ